MEDQKIDFFKLLEESSINKLDNSSSIAQMVRKELNFLVQHNRPTFPGSQPVSFLRKHLDWLLSEDYYVCEKSDGLRLLLFFPGPHKYDESAFFIDRECNVYQIPNCLLQMRETTRAENIYHEGTILDGELVYPKDSDVTRTTLYFLIFDCLAINGENICTADLNLRLKMIQNHVIAPNPSFQCPFKLRQKEMFKPYGISLAVERLSSQLHSTDGLIFTPVNREYVTGTFPMLLKWKPPNLNTVDFMLGSRNADEWNLLVFDGKHHIPYATLCSHQPSFTNEAMEGKIVECSYSNSSWHFMKFRTDKTNANYIKVVENIMISIKEGVTMEELRAVEPEIRRNWKKRNP